MNINEAFPSTFLKAADLKGQAVRVRMTNVEMQDVGDGEKPILFFEGKERGLVLNKTNSSMLSDLFGEETAAWAGQIIEVYPDKTSFQGKIVDCLRVRGIAPPPVETDGEAEETPF